VVRVVGAQPGLFDPTRTVERRLASGATVRVTLEPLDDRHVRVVAYLRRTHDGARWERRAGEEGRTYPIDALGLGLPFEEIFA
jgi:hypothetical protein